jgi:sporulation protein YlmC with PRC-barrel domain
MILHDTLPLVLAQPHPDATAKPALRARAVAGSVRLRREASTTRTWLLELELVLPEIDPEQILLESHGFLVDGTDGTEIGVVDDVETDGPEGVVSALTVACGWLGRRRVRVDADAIEALVPAERRIVVTPQRL